MRLSTGCSGEILTTKVSLIQKELFTDRHCHQPTSCKVNLWEPGMIKYLQTL